MIWVYRVDNQHMQQNAITSGPLTSALARTQGRRDRLVTTTRLLSGLAHSRVVKHEHARHFRRAVRTGVLTPRALIEALCEPLRSYRGRPGCNVFC